MATATATLCILQPQNFHCECSGRPSGGEYGMIPVGTLGVKGIGFPPLVDSGAAAIFRVPTLYTATTGVTVNLLLADDPLNADAGKVSRWAATVKLLTSGTDMLDWTAAGTVTAASFTAPAANVVKTLAIAIVAANIDSVVADSWCAIRIQRLGGSDALDVHKGRIVLLAVDVRDT
jgi:hypothetical protein